MSGKIEALALRAHETKGLPHHAAVRALRVFIKEAPASVLEAQILLIEDERAFHILLEAGLTSPLLDAALARWQALRKGGG